jgi:hypothetical protein
MRNRSRKMSRLSAKRTNKNRKNSVRVGYQQLETRRVLAAAPFYPNELLVQYFPQDASARAVIRQNVAGEVLETVHTNPMIQKGMGALEVIRIGNGMTVEQAVAHVKSLPGVMYAEPNFVYEYFEVSNDTHYTNGNMWNLFSDDLVVPSDRRTFTSAFLIRALTSTIQIWSTIFSTIRLTQSTEATTTAMEKSTTSKVGIGRTTTTRPKTTWDMALTLQER